MNFVVTIDLFCLIRDDAESRSTFAQELSKARQLAAENLKRAVESEERSQGAIEMQKSMEQDIKEAAEVQKFNAQLHKDLAREQVHRKRLHNEIEDMKGDMICMSCVEDNGLL